MRVMNDLRERAIERCRFTEQVDWEELKSADGYAKELRRDYWEESAYILKAVEEYEKEQVGITDRLSCSEKPNS